MRQSTDRPGLRLFSAAICILYGFAKLNGSQFTVLDSQLSKPMGDVSGFWLTWYYFGYSKVYGTLIALIEVGGGLLLIWPRTALLGALLLLPVAANILVVDILYGVDLSGTAVAAVLTCFLALIIWPHMPQLRDAVLPPLQLAARPSPRHLAIAGAFVAAAFAITFWGAHYNNRAPTPIDGVWIITADSRQPARWTHVFFEYNRAHWAAFRAPDGTDTPRHFDVTGSAVRVHETWLDRSSPTVMSGTFDGGKRIRLEVAETAGGGTIELEFLRGPRGKAARY